MHHPNFRAGNATSSPSLSRALFSRALFALLAAILLSSPSAFAQFRAYIQGTVSDTQGGVIPGANLTLVNVATNETQTRVSNGQGVYSFNGLPPSRYRLTAAAPGFQTKVMENVQIIPEQPNSVNVQLQVAAATQSVTVDASTAPLMDAETPNIGGTITENQIQHMPSFGRDVFQLTNLAQGTTGDQSQAAGGGTFSLPGSQGPGGGGANTGIFSVENGPQSLGAGQQYESNGISIDGIPTVSAVWGGTSVVTPSEESVDNVRVVANGYDAEFGRFSGEQIQVTSKSGTNQVHGSLFFQAWRPGLNAYQRYNGPGSLNPGTPSSRGLLRNSQRFNQMGGSVGGPIWRDKIFAFFSYETERNNSDVSGTGWYETPAFRKLAPSGSIASTYLNFPGAEVKSNGMISVTCAEVGLTEGKNCITIPGQGLNVGSPLRSGLGTHDLTYTSPTNPGVGGGLDPTTADIAFYTTSNPTHVIDQQFNGRLDANATSRDHVTFAIYWVPVDQTSFNSSDRGYNLWHHSGINDAISAIWNHTFSPSMLNEARANAAGWRWNELSTNPQAPFGLPNDSINGLGGGGGGGAQLATFGAGGPSVLNQWTYNYRDIATKVAGSHTIKFGGELTQLYYLNANPSAARPSFNFFNIWDFLNDAPQSESGTFDPATGTPTLGRQDNRQNIWGAFVQDDWRLSPGLTLNLGLRYSYFGSLSAKQNNMFGVRLGSGADLLTGLSVERGSDIWNPQKWNFGPEVGFAWSPASYKQRLVIRGGYGLNYNQEEIALSANAYFNPGLFVTPAFTMGTPSSPNPGIVYAVPSDPKSLYGYPANPNTISTFGPNGLPTNGNTVSVQAFSHNMPTMYTQHFSLDTQTDLGGQFVFMLGYQGSVQRHIYFHEDMNAVAAVRGIALNPQVSSVSFWGNNGKGSYNAMLASLRHQFSHQFMVEAQFTWARSMDTSSAPYSEQPYPYDPNLSWGRSDYDLRRQEKIYGMWQPVFFRGAHSLAEKLVGGWSLSAIVNLHTGFPWSPVYVVPSSAGNLYCSTCGYSTVYPAAFIGGAHNDTSNDAFKSGPGVGDGTNRNFPLAATNPTGAEGTYFTPPTLSPTPNGTGLIPQAPGVRRNSFTGPGYRNVDATITKTFGIPGWHRESAGLEVRLDAFNVFNNLNFNPNSISNNISSSNFGQAESALGSRTVTMQARFHF